MCLNFERAFRRARRQSLPASSCERRYDSDFAGSGTSDAASTDRAHLIEILKEKPMAVIRDVMPDFDLLQPSSVVDAQKLLQQHGADAWVMAGGLDSFDWLKDRIKKPKVVVDLSGIEELRGVRVADDGIEIGAMTTLTD